MAWNCNATELLKKLHICHTMKMIQNIKDGYAKMSSTQLEKEMKKSKWGVVVITGIVLLFQSLKMVIIPNTSWFAFLDNFVWLFLVGFFVFNYRTIGNELASREEAHA
jgi:hypothetical protein